MREREREKKQSNNNTTTHARERKQSNKNNDRCKREKTIKTNETIIQKKGGRARETEREHTAFMYFVFG